MSWCAYGMLDAADFWRIIDTMYICTYMLYFSLSRPQRSHIFSSLRQYIFAIERMVDTIIEKRQSKDRTFTYEDYYTKIVSAFATVCGFQVE